MTAKKKANKPNSVAVAKQADGTVQLTFTIPWKDITKKREETVKELAKNVNVPGFRKGKAPIEKAEERLDKQFVLERTLAQVLPKLFADSIKEHKVKPAMYPKFELLHAHEEEDWQVRATTAELPSFELGDYKKALSQARDPKQDKELTREQKENLAISTLGEHFKFTIPKILIEEEINSRLSSLLERIEKLGMSLESYLSSIKKTAEELRADYGTAAERAIRLDIVLGVIAEKEEIKVSEDEIKAFMSVASASDQTVSDDQKSTIGAFLIKRKVLEKLAAMI